MVWRSAAVFALALALGGCALIRPKDSLTSDDFKYTAEQQGDFDFSFSHCKADADIILANGPPVEGEEYRERLNARDHALIQCMQRRGYAYRD